MEALPIIAILLTIIIVILVFSIIKSLFKAAITAFMLVLLLLGLGTYLVYKDAMDLKENLNTQEKLLVLKNNEKVYAAFSIKELNNLENMKIANQDQLNIISDSIKNDDFNNLSNEYYKLLIFNLSAFNKSISDGIKLDTGEMSLDLSKEQVISIIESDDAIGELIDILIKSQNMQDGDMDSRVIDYAKQEIRDNLKFKDDPEIKSFIFALMIYDLAQDEGPAFLIAKIKDGTLEIVPKTALFKAIDMVPSPIISKLSSKALSSEAAS